MGEVSHELGHVTKIIFQRGIDGVAVGIQFWSVRVDHVNSPFSSPWIHNVSNDPVGMIIIQFVVLQGFDELLVLGPVFFALGGNNSNVIIAAERRMELVLPLCICAPFSSN